MKLVGHQGGDSCGVKHSIRVGLLGTVRFEQILKGSEKLILCFLREDCSRQSLRHGILPNCLTLCRRASGEETTGKGKAREGRG